MNQMSDGGMPDRDDPRRRILMLVPHEPFEDPRIQWVTDLCAQVCRTDIFASVWTRHHPHITYDGRVSIERFRIGEQASTTAMDWGKVAERLGNLPTVSRFIQRQHQAFLVENQALAGGAVAGPYAGKSFVKRLAHRADHAVGGVCRFLSYYLGLQPLFDSLVHRATAVCLKPSVVVCHDIFALYAAIAVKKKLGCPVIYDSHEWTPQSDFLSEPWEVRFWTWFERRLARQADALIAVNPQLAATMKRQYGHPRVLSVPNAEPWTAVRNPSHLRGGSHPVKFLLQGNACQGRGFEFLLDQWRSIPKDKATLYIRCPESPYKEGLRNSYADLIATGHVEFLAPVKSHQLTEASTFADVGVVPYPVKIFNNTPNLNHLYCCPNKLSQYMQAGLAILATNTHFVQGRLDVYQCGTTYSAADPGSFRHAVHALIDDPAVLRRMKTNAYDMARKDFNWEVQSKPYVELLKEFVPAREEAIAPPLARRKAA